MLAKLKNCKLIKNRITGTVIYADTIIKDSIVQTESSSVKEISFTKENGLLLLVLFNLVNSKTIFWTKL